MAETYKNIDLTKSQFDQWTLVNSVENAQYITQGSSDPDGQARRLIEIVSKSCTLINLVWQPGTIETVPMMVRGSLTTTPDDVRSIDVGYGLSAFVVGDEWGHVGFRLAFGDYASDVKFREYLAQVSTDGTDGVGRLARWLTPSGQVEAARLRRAPKSDRHQHSELMVLDHYHAVFESQRRRTA